ncbi:ATP-binding protein [Haloarcula sediminis]|uniref:ATP-binding protein n=1 Tax=Haloarcula sediminis TaxID=3111777 RepID=UPI002D7A0538|nr:ATP-binding protein [Haloarcula sp. CK38]
MLNFLSEGDLVFASYVVLFGAAAVACLASAFRVARLDDPDTRRGLLALLLTSSGWATAHVAFLIVPSVPIKYAFYQIGLVIGLSTVGAWLYFCSAYTNRSLHRRPIYRRVAVGVFLAIVALKLTNPLHQLYFEAEFVTMPFPHLAVSPQLAHWLVMGLSYGLAMIGYFMLLEHVTKVNSDTTPLLVLIGITGLPLVLDIIGFVTPYLIDTTYGPLGVAVFALGIVFVYFDQFQTIRLAANHDEAILVVSEDDRIRDYNPRASQLFPELDETGTLGSPLWTVLPKVTDALEAPSSVIECRDNDETRYCRVSESPFSARQAQLGRVITFTDITDQEQYRQELERQNERLEQFASMVSHDLRNPLTVALARVELVQEESYNENLATAVKALDRMEALIADVLSLARNGQPIDEMGTVSLASIAAQSWDMIDATSGESELIVDNDLRFTADSTRLQQLLENLFRNAIEHGGPDVTVHVGTLDSPTGFYVVDDGTGLPVDERESLFEMGFSTAETGTGFGLSIVKEIAEAHGWQIKATDSETGGARFEITGVTTE